MLSLLWVGLNNIYRTSFAFYILYIKYITDIFDLITCCIKFYVSEYHLIQVSVRQTRVDSENGMCFYNLQILYCMVHQWFQQKLLIFLFQCPGRIFLKSWLNLTHWLGYQHNLTKWFVNEMIRLWWSGEMESFTQVKASS